MNSRRGLLTLGLFVASMVCASAQSDAETTRTIHVLAALCDNDSQGIMPVNEELGDGDKPIWNLYWGAMYGVKTVFDKSEDWERLERRKKVDDVLLERCVYRHKATGAILVADAYRGSQIKRTVKDFVESVAGQKQGSVKAGERQVAAYSAADMVCYIGHNGLMDFTLDMPDKKRKGSGPAAALLACRSKAYFYPFLQKMECSQVLLTTGLMAPEAYTLEAALEAWLAGNGSDEIEKAAARAYDKHQSCDFRAAMGLFFTATAETAGSSK
jgi:hypothetical protein